MGHCAVCSTTFPSCIILLTPGDRHIAPRGILLILRSYILLTLVHLTPVAKWYKIQTHKRFKIMLFIILGQNACDFSG